MPDMPEDSNKLLAIDEFKSVITTYILPIFGAIGDLSLCETPEKNMELIEIISNDKHCYAKFYPQIVKNDIASPFHYKIEIYDKGLKKYATKILNELMKITMYACVPPYKIKRYYGKSAVLMNSYRKKI